MQADDKAARETLGAGGAHVILANDFEEARARHPRDVSGLPQAQHDRRADDDLKIVPRIGEQRGAGHRGAIAEPEQAGQDDQHAEPETRDREEQDREKARDVVAEAVGPKRADDRHRDPDDPRQDDRDQRDLGGQRTAPQQHVGDALGAEKGAAEVAAHDVAEPMEVLHDEWIAETEIGHVAGALGLGQLGEALGAKNRDKRIPRQDPQDGEDNDRDAEDRQPAEYQPPHDIAVHGGRLRVAARAGQGFPAVGKVRAEPPPVLRFASESLPRLRGRVGVRACGRDARGPIDAHLILPPLTRWAPLSAL